MLTYSITILPTIFLSKLEDRPSYLCGINIVDFPKQDALFFLCHRPVFLVLCWVNFGVYLAGTSATAYPFSVCHTMVYETLFLQTAYARETFAELNIENMCSINLQSLLFFQSQVTRKQLKSKLVFSKKKYWNSFWRKYSCSCFRHILEILSLILALWFKLYDCFLLGFPVHGQCHNDIHTLAGSGI